MTDLANAAIAASILVGMVSIPAASQSLDTAETSQPALSNISETEEVPVEQSTQISSESFVRTVDSAFSSFRTEISSGDVTGKLESPESSLEVDSGPGMTEWRLESSEGTISVRTTSGSVVEKVETPHGSLEKKISDGNTERSFEGSDREKVEQLRDKLREKLEQRKREYKRKADSARRQHYRSSVDLDVEPETPEKAVISNTGSGELDLSGWRIENSDSEGKELQVALEPGQTLHVYSNNYAEKSEIDEKQGDVYVYETGITWPDESGEAVLLDPSGNEMESRAY